MFVYVMLLWIMHNLVICPQITEASGIAVKFRKRTTSWELRILEAEINFKQLLNSEKKNEKIIIITKKTKKKK